MTVSDRKLGDEIFASILVDNQIFFSGGPHKEIDIDLFIIFISEGDFVIIGNARV
jgi:hypothetical protein